MLQWRKRQGSRKDNGEVVRACSVSRPLLTEIHNPGKQYMVSTLKGDRFRHSAVDFYLVLKMNLPLL